MSEPLPARTEGTERVALEIFKDGWTGQLQVSITAYDADDAGDGYRLVGPKFNGSSTRLRAVNLNERDAREIRSYLDRGGLIDAEVDRLRAIEQRVRRFSAEMRSYCSPYGIAAIYADRLDAALDGADR